jgi:hypothetical protein
MDGQLRLDGDRGAHDEDETPSHTPDDTAAGNPLFGPNPTSVSLGAISSAEPVRMKENVLINDGM